MIELKNIGFCVPDGQETLTILQDVSLTIPTGITAITGQNGGGKSTLIKLLMGIEQPTAGRILYNGADVTSLGVTERAKLGFTIAFQQPVRFKGLTVKKLLRLSCGDPEANTGKLCDTLSAVGLCAKNYVDREIDGTLSGGELKRIELACALAKGGDVFLLDEPEAGIDLWSFEELIHTFTELRDKTVIIVTHQKKILDAADHIVLLNKTTQPQFGPKELMLPRIRESEQLCGRLKKEN